MNGLILRPFDKLRAQDEDSLFLFLVLSLSKDVFPQ